jgi:hypothetical protein
MTPAPKAPCQGKGIDIGRLNERAQKVAIYPPEIRPPYQERMAVLGERLYGALGIARDDAPTRARARAQNGK